MTVPSITVHILCTMLMEVKAQALFLRQINTAKILKELACDSEKKILTPFSVQSTQNTLSSWAARSYRGALQL